MFFAKILPFLSYCGAFVRRSCLNSPPRQLIIMRKCVAILPDELRQRTYVAPGSKMRRYRLFGWPISPRLWEVRSRTVHKSNIPSLLLNVYSCKGRAFLKTTRVSPEIMQFSLIFVLHYRYLTTNFNQFSRRFIRLWYKFGQLSSARASCLLVKLTLFKIRCLKAEGL